jgi:TonB family protein
MKASRMRIRLIIGISFSLACLAEFISSPRLSAGESPLTWDTTFQVPAGGRSSASSTKFSSTGAVDAKRVRHSGSDYERKRLPWLLDITNAVAPYGPYRSDRFPGPQGSGLFQLKLDLKTGYVTKAIVAKSTGSAELDRLAVAALQKWRWKPGKWKEVEMGVAFTRP